jgi:hypothetical protein
MPMETMMDYVFHKVSDLKNRARKIARDEDMPRYLALDEAARRGGFANFANARKNLPDSDACQTYEVELRQRWRDREAREHGVASLVLSLSAPVGQLVRPHQFVGYLSGCTLEGDAMIIVDGFMRDRRDSRTDLGRVARALQFMDATGLKPSRAQRCYPKGRWDNRPPIADHDHCWFDPDGGVHLLSTEPYPGRATMYLAEQTDWQERHDWQCVRTEWGSMHGFGTEFFLLCPTAYAIILRKKLAALERSPAPISDDAVDDGGSRAKRIAI